MAAAVAATMQACIFPLLRLMKPTQPHWKARMQTLFPGREALEGHPHLQHLAEHLREPLLWRLHHESVARGVAVGFFWAFVLPVAQILVATVHCVWWRANIPVAAAVTLITNPFTIGFWLWLAYQVGSFFIGPSVPGAAAGGEGALAWLAQYGWPTVLGMGIFAVGGATVGYLAVKFVWRLRLVLRRRFGWSRAKQGG